MTNPGAGTGLAHREGPVRQVGGEVSTLFGRPSTNNCHKRATPNLSLSALSDKSHVVGSVVRSASVLGQAHTPRKRLLLLAACALGVLLVPAVSSAVPPHSAATLRAHDAALAAQSRAAVLGLYSLDEKLATAQARLAVLQKRATALRAEHASLAQQLNVARRGTHIAQRRLAEQLRVLYEQGDVEPLEIVFGARTIDEALSSIDNLNRVSGQGEDVLRQLRVARVSLGAATRRLAARQSALAAAVGEAQATENALVSARAERQAYIGSLAAQRRLTERQIGAVVEQANAARLRSDQLARVSAVDSLSSPVALTTAAPVSTLAGTGGGRMISVTATGYALAGRTATGIGVGWGVVAVDPSVIPLGTHMTIPGYGEAVAADTGGAIVGATIDLWFPTVAQANAWGRRVVSIVLH
jgi:3D (Asp-Asp-Asp) domain-containing protein/peptidoglycan hydrolase CwlO-like protein